MKFKVELTEGTAPKECRSWEEVELLTTVVTDKLKNQIKYDMILGIIPARLTARDLAINQIRFLSIRNKKLQKGEMPKLLKDKKYLIVDDIYDTGNTFYEAYEFIKEFNCDFAFLKCRYKQNSSILIGKSLNRIKWIAFPWGRTNRQ